MSSDPRRQSLAYRLFRRYPAALARRLLSAAVRDRLRRAGALTATLTRQPSGFAAATLARVFGQRLAGHTAEALVEPVANAQAHQVHQVQTKECSAADQAGPLQLRMDAQPLVSIVIPVYNQCAFTLACLRSIQRYTDGIAYEVIIADDHSTDETRDIEALCNGTVRVARPDANVGFLLNVNQAVAVARGDYVLILNNDTEVTPGWLDALLATMADDPSVGMVGPKLLFEDGSLQEAGGIIWRDGSGWNYGREGDPEDPQFNYVREADYISGACILLRRALWEQLGGFSEHFKPAYYEDTDLAFRLREQGLRVLYQPASVVFHFEGKSHGTDVTSGIKRYQQDNAVKFTKKWRAVLQREHFANAQHVFLARDRSRFRQTVLLIDDYLPSLDDAEGRPLLLTLRWLVASGFNVKFLAADGDGRPLRRRPLQQMGVQVIADSGFVDGYRGWLAEHGRYIDWFWFFSAGTAARYRDVVAEHPQVRVAFSAETLDSTALQRRYQREQQAGMRAMVQRWQQRERTLLGAASVLMLADAEALAEVRGWQSGAAVVQLPDADGGVAGASHQDAFDSAMRAHFSSAKQDAWSDEPAD